MNKLLISGKVLRKLLLKAEYSLKVIDKFNLIDCKLYSISYADNKHISIADNIRIEQLIIKLVKGKT